MVRRRSLLRSSSDCHGHRSYLRSFPRLVYRATSIPWKECTQYNCRFTIGCADGRTGFLGGFVLGPESSGEAANPLVEFHEYSIRSANAVAFHDYLSVHG